MTVSIRPKKAKGTVTAPSSKSMAHRLLLSAGLSLGESTVFNLPRNRDILATVSCLRALGAFVRVSDGTAFVAGIDPVKRGSSVTLPCFESGSTLRFLLPVCLLSDAPAVLSGTESLLSRPLSEYASICGERGIRFELGRTSVTVQGRLTGGTFRLRGDVSSQFVTGLLYALPLVGKNSLIRLFPPVESRPYIELTLSALAAFGVSAGWTDSETLAVTGGQRYLPQCVSVEGDWSNAAFLEGLNLLGGEVSVTGLDENSLQGDRVYRKYFEALKTGTPRLDLSDCPDLGPVLFALAAVHHGAEFTGIGRLRIKESDRVAAMREELSKFRIRTEADADTMTVFPGLQMPQSILFGHNDHRIVMSLALLCTLTGGTICGAEAIAKSFPDFFEKLSELGVSYELDQQQ